MKKFLVSISLFVMMMGIAACSGKDADANDFEKTSDIITKVTGNEESDNVKVTESLASETDTAETEEVKHDCSIVPDEYGMCSDWYNSEFDCEAILLTEENSVYKSPSNCYIVRIKNNCQNTYSVPFNAIDHLLKPGEEQWFFANAELDKFAFGLVDRYEYYSCGYEQQPLGADKAEDGTWSVMLPNVQDQFCVTEYKNANGNTVFYGLDYTSGLKKSDDPQLFQLGARYTLPADLEITSAIIHYHVRVPQDSQGVWYN